MKLKFLGFSACALIAAALVTPACTISEGDVDSIGGFGGSGDTGGSSTGATDSGGAPSTGGTGQGGEGGEPILIDCQVDSTDDGTPGSCDPISESDFDGTEDEYNDYYLCQSCIQDLCCEEYETCFATGPDTACALGTTARGDGEYACITECLTALGDDFIGDQDDLDTCAAECGSSECSEDGAGPVAKTLGACVLGLTAMNAGCTEECGIFVP